MKLLKLMGMASLIILMVPAEPLHAHGRPGRCDVFRDIVAAPDGMTNPASTIDLQTQLKTLSELPHLSLGKSDRRVLGFGFFGDRSEQVMDLIGIGRETAFQNEGEGSGNRIDIDGYDPDSFQLVVFSPHSNEITGGYRLAFMDEKVRKAGGLHGLYISSLFNLKEFLTEDMLEQSVEVGRSWVLPKYQRGWTFKLLMHLNAEALLLRPKKTVMMGPVSFSLNKFSTDALLHIIGYLQSKHRFEGFDKIKPLNPFLQAPVNFSMEELAGRIASTKTWDQLQEWVDEAQAVAGLPKVTLPPIVSSYLSLNAQFGPCTVDLQFGSVDCFTYVDLRKIDRDKAILFAGNEKTADQVLSRR